MLFPQITCKLTVDFYRPQKGTFPTLLDGVKQRHKALHVSHTLRAPRCDGTETCSSIPALQWHGSAFLLSLLPRKMCFIRKWQWMIHRLNLFPLTDVKLEGCVALYCNIRGIRAHFQVFHWEVLSTLDFTVQSLKSSLTVQTAGGRQLTEQESKRAKWELY